MSGSLEPLPAGGSAAGGDGPSAGGLAAGHGDPDAARLWGDDLAVPAPVQEVLAPPGVLVAEIRKMRDEGKQLPRLGADKKVAMPGLNDNDGNWDYGWLQRVHHESIVECDQKTYLSQRDIHNYWTGEDLDVRVQRRLENKEF